MFDILITGVDEAGRHAEGSAPGREFYAAPCHSSDEVAHVGDTLAFDRDVRAARRRAGTVNNIAACYQDIEHPGQRIWNSFRCEAAFVNVAAWRSGQGAVIPVYPRTRRARRLPLEREKGIRE
jgi:hypothetical protein